MSKNETALVALSDIPTALGLLSRLPVPPADMERTAAAAWAYPVAGLILGALAALAGAIAHAFGLPSPLTALIALGFLILATGAMHEDGLADTADGLWGGWTRDRRLEIMKDSQIGTYGVVALVLSLAARWAALSLLYDIGSGIAAAALVTAATLSRAAMPLLMARLPHARAGGLSHSVGPVPERTAWLALAIAALVGTALLLLYHGDHLLSSTRCPSCYAKFAAGYLIPLTVALVSAVDIHRIAFGGARRTVGVVLLAALFDGACRRCGTVGRLCRSALGGRVRGLRG